MITLDTSRTQVILGPPGTGKTTRGLAIVEDALSAGTDPGDVAYLAFTNQAADEARSRAKDRFGFTDEQMPWYSTIHSLALRQTSQTGRYVMKDEDFKTVCDRAGFEYEGRTIKDEDAVSTAPWGDALAFLDSQARATGRSLLSVMRERTLTHPRDRFALRDVLHFHNHLIRYKASSGAIDFTDMLENFIESGVAPAVDVLIVDEAQDLSALQWKVVERLAENAAHVYLIGDDDQAIFRWAGADVNQFLDITYLLAERDAAHVLDQSHRVPHASYTLATSILRNIPGRANKLFHPTDVQGSTVFVHGVDELTLGTSSWRFLGRHGYQLSELQNECKERGWFFQVRGQGSNQTPAARAVIAWENMRAGHDVPLAEVKHVMKALGYRKVLRGDDDLLVNALSYPSIDFTRPWHDALTHLPKDDVRYFRQARRAGQTLARKNEDGLLVPANPQIEISTIHGAKGGEADNVYLLTDVSESTFRAMERDISDESRVYYVGTTRARDTLVIRQPRGPKAFQLGGK